MNAKKYYLLFALFIFSLTSNASHFLGYDMSLTRLPDNSYKVRLTIYKSNSPTAAAMPTSISFATYANLTNANANLNFSTSRVAMYVATYDPATCPPDGANTTLVVGLFDYTITALQAATLSNPNGYYFSHSICCREDGISNVINSSSYGINFTMDIPKLSGVTGGQYNSSPRFSKIPLTHYCVGKPYSLNWDANDPDGDSLVFALITPTSGSSDLKPFYNVEYAPGYNINYNIMDGSPDITINPSTGQVSFIPTRIGKYIVAIKCEEWRKINGVPTKIGTIFRDFELRTVLCPEAPPITSVGSNSSSTIVDTVNINEELILNFTSIDTLGDSLFMYILPNLSLNENVLNPNRCNAQWGKVGSTQSGILAENLVISDTNLVIGQFKWTPPCFVARNDPYSFKVVVRDQTCPTPFYDTTTVFIYVNKKQNIAPYFTSPDSFKNNLTKTYYINAGELIQFSGDSMLIAKDKDTTNIVKMLMEPDPTNGQANSALVFTPSNHQKISTATFSWQTTCTDGRSEPYKIKFIAEDNDCLKHDSANLNVVIHVKKQIESFPIYGDSIILDTTQLYTYRTAPQLGVNHFWFGSNLTVISGQGTNTVSVKWHSLNSSKLTCVLSSGITSCNAYTDKSINTSTGISIDKNSKIKIYPNPTTNIISIEGLSQVEKSEVTIYDIQGKLILIKELFENGTIDLSDFTQGVYMIRIGDVVQRIVKM